MELSYFSECRTLHEAKLMFKNLALKYHPAMGGAKDKMDEIHTEYLSLCRYPYLNFANQIEDVKQDFLDFPEVLNKVLGIDVVIELIGNWIWLSGNTYKYRQYLRKVGFYYSMEKRLWYYRSLAFRSENKKPMPMTSIRTLHGSDIPGHVQNADNNQHLLTGRHKINSTTKSGGEQS